MKLHNLLCTEKHRTHFSSKLPRPHCIQLCNNLDYKILNIKSHTNSKVYDLSSVYISILTMMNGCCFSHTTPSRFTCKIYVDM